MSGSTEDKRQYFETVRGLVDEKSFQDLSWRFILGRFRDPGHEDLELFLTEAVAWMVGKGRHLQAAQFCLKYLMVWIQEREVFKALSITSGGSDLVGLEDGEARFWADVSHPRVRAACRRARLQQAETAEAILERFSSQGDLGHLRADFGELIAELYRVVLRVWAQAASDESPEKWLDFWTGWRLSADENERLLLDRVLTEEADDFPAIHIADAVCALVPKNLSKAYRPGQDKVYDNCLEIADLLQPSWVKQMSLEEFRRQAQKLVDIQLPVNSK